MPIMKATEVEYVRDYNKLHAPDTMLLSENMILCEYAHNESYGSGICQRL